MRLLLRSSKFIIGLLLVFALPRSHAQGTLQWTVTFDGPPLMPASDEIAINYYSEKGMVFTPIGTGQFGRSGGAPVNSGFPKNGSAYLFGSFTYSLAASTSNGQRFGVISVDLAEFSTLYQTPLTVQFVGYKPDGNIVTTEFITDGVIDGDGPLNDFERFYFDSRFAEVMRVEVPTYGWSLDNMVFSNVVPEPGAAALGIVAAAVFGLRFLRRKRKSK